MLIADFLHRKQPAVAAVLDSMEEHLIDVQPPESAQAHGRTVRQPYPGVDDPDIGGNRDSRPAKRRAKGQRP